MVDDITVIKLTAQTLRLQQDLHEQTSSKMEPNKVEDGSITIHHHQHLTPQPSAIRMPTVSAVNEDVKQLESHINYKVLPSFTPQAESFSWQSGISSSSSAAPATAASISGIKHMFPVLPTNDVESSQSPFYSVDNHNVSLFDTPVNSSAVIPPLNK